VDQKIFRSIHQVYSPHRVCYGLAVAECFVDESAGKTGPAHHLISHGLAYRHFPISLRSKAQSGLSIIFSEGRFTGVMSLDA
jgi:hypothetical protein